MIIKTKIGEREVPTFIIRRELIGVHKTSHTIFDAEDIVVNTVHITIECTSISYETSGVDTTEVERTRGLKLGSFQAEGVHEVGRDTTVQGTERCMVVKRRRRVVRIRLLASPTSVPLI